MSEPPRHVQDAARVVDGWLKDQEAKSKAPAAPVMSDSERLNRARTFDQSKMPEWKDPRPEPTAADRWRVRR
jgi:hypothetical protein